MASLKWSSPTRRLKQQSLPHIPSEIYLEIFSYLEPGEELTSSESKCVLSNLAFVCRFFSALALPQIFKSLTFSGASHQELNPPNYASFCRSVIGKIEPAHSLALYVKELQVTSWVTEDKSLKWCYKAFLTIYTKAMAQMPNIISLKLQDIHICKRMLKALASLKNLQNLSIINCQISNEVNAEDIKTLRLSRLSSLECMLIPDIDSKIFCALKQSFNFTRLKVLRTNEWRLAISLAEEDKQLPLEELDIDQIRDVTYLERIFLKLPSLIRLRVRACDLGLNSLDDHPFPEDVLPNIRFIDCPASLIYRVLPRRQLQQIIFHPTYLRLHQLPRILNLLSQCASLLSLDVPVKVLTTPTFHADFPRLHELTTRFGYTNTSNDTLHDPGRYNTKLKDWTFKIIGNKDDFKFAISEICQGPSLLTVKILHLELDKPVQETFLWDLPFQHMLIEEYVQNKFPNVHQIDFTPSIHWRLGIEKQWKPFTSAATRHVIVKSIAEGVEIVDYRDCLASLISS